MQYSTTQTTIKTVKQYTGTIDEQMKRKLDDKIRKMTRRQNRIAKFTV